MLLIQLALCPSFIFWGTSRRCRSISSIRKSRFHWDEQCFLVESCCICLWYPWIFVSNRLHNFYFCRNRHYYFRSSWDSLPDEFSWAIHYSPSTKKRITGWPAQLIRKLSPTWSQFGRKTSYTFQWILNDADRNRNRWESYLKRMTSCRQLTSAYH